jgi:hypothetical protein
MCAVFRIDIYNTRKNGGTHNEHENTAAGSAYVQIKLDLLQLSHTSPPSPELSVKSQFETTAKRPTSPLIKGINYQKNHAEAQFLHPRFLRLHMSQAR